jgi:hypothetical protein
MGVYQKKSNETNSMRRRKRSPNRINRRTKAEIYCISGAAVDERVQGVVWLGRAVPDKDIKGGWDKIVVCDTHKFSVSCNSYSQCRRFSVFPDLFCPECKRFVSGYGIELGE